MIIDTHCHIQFQGYNDDRDEVIARCVAKNVIMNAVGTQMDTSKKAVEMAEKHENIYATIGLHPIHLHAKHIDEEESSFLSREEDFDEEYYGELAKSKKVIGVGECGLELYHIPEGQNKDIILKKQKEIFIKQVRFAWSRRLPIVVHCRDAYQELINVLKLEIGNWKLDFLPGVIHCYASDWENAQEYLNMGFYLGFTGTLTFPPKKTDPKPGEDLLEVAQNIPLDKFLIETDAPYLAPQAYRGKRCEPWMVEEVAKKMAEIRQKSVEEIINLSIENAKNLFTRINLKNS